MNSKNRKAVVVGGSNGIGLSISNSLTKKGYHVEILDICEPDRNLLKNSECCAYTYCDLRYFDETPFENLKNDETVDVLMITAGIGRVADFGFLHTAEIDKLITVNELSVLKIIRIFYDRIKGEKPFYCGVMGSIAGLVSSPAFSVYAASKAAVCRFTESVNAELEKSGTKNRILNVSPGSVKGTKFSGGENDPSLTEELADSITEKLKNRETLFIPDYETTYKSVIERYRNAPREYGLSSYDYKKNAGRILNQKQVKIGYLSGTFDLFHIGHLNLIRRAKRQCDYLIVGVHPDASHKGKETFIPFEERLEIVRACKYVDKAVQSCPEDSDAWDLWHYDKLFVGSDYKGTERFAKYEEYFKDKNVEIVYLPYTQSTNSTQIRKTVMMKTDGTKQKD